MTALTTPDGQTLLGLEAEARRHGRGIPPESLHGEWWLDQLWGKQGNGQGSTTALLRGIRACLAITALDGRLQLRNSVRLGALTLEFSGPGWLGGKRPLLRFRFERMVLRWGGREIWQKALPAPAPNKLPFFALIACKRSGNQGWLAARGRGGGLAAWRLRPAAPRG
jgi:hypothetical protein